MKYILDVKIMPKENYIKVKGSIKDIEIPNGANVFCLNENFKISKLTSNGKDIDYIHDKNKSNPPYDLVSKPVILKTPLKEFDFEYDGYMPEIIGGVNQINEDIVELAMYSGWYPKVLLYTENTEEIDFNIERRGFEFELTVELPPEYSFAANAEIKNIDTLSNGKTVYSLLSYGVDRGDIALFASNKVIKIERTLNEITVFAICPPAMEKKNTLKLEILIEAQERMTELLGEPKIKQSTCYINRPCGGWGYVRTSIVLMPGITDENDEALKDLSREAAIHFSSLDIHELAHYWWGIASSTGSNDWINEGGAEYTMLCIKKDMLGLENYNEFTGGYIERINACTSDEAIIETPNHGEIREINSYTKTAIMYIGAEIRFGKENLFKFLRKFYEQNKAKGNADTDRFLDLCEQILGKEAREYFNWLLYAKGWQNIDIQKDILLYCE